MAAAAAGAGSSCGIRSTSENFSFTKLFKYFTFDHRRESNKLRVQIINVMDSSFVLENDRSGINR